MIIVLVFIILIFYSLFIPVIISLPLLLLLEINFSIYYLEYYDKITINTIIFYLFILTLKNYSNKKFLNK